MTIDCKNITITSFKPSQDEALPDRVLRVEYLSGWDGYADWALVLSAEESNTWVVNLHGHGSHGDQLFTREDIKRDWLSRFRELGLGIVSPNLRNNAWMSPAAVCDLRNLLNFIRTQYEVERFIFISGSMGGTGNLIYATQHPEDVAGIIAFCPASDVGYLYQCCAESDDDNAIAVAIRDNYTSDRGRLIALLKKHCVLDHRHVLTMPVYIAHGDDDKSIPVSHARQLADGWVGDNLQYVEIPGGHHDSPLAKEYLEQGLGWILK